MDSSFNPCNWSTPESAKWFFNFPAFYVPSVATTVLDFYYRTTGADQNAVRSKIPLIVDVGCGSGQLSAALSSFCDRLIAIDLSAAKLADAHEINERPNVDYKWGRAEELPSFCPPNSADLIVASMSAHFFDNQEFYDGVRRCLKPGGVLAISGFWHRGVEYKDESIYANFDDIALEEECDVEVVDRVSHLLFNSYRDLFCPLEQILREQFSLKIGMSPQEVRRWFLSISGVFTFSEEMISDVLDTLPPMQATLILDIFFIFGRI